MSSGATTGGKAGRTYQFAFVVQQVLGFVSTYHHLRRYVERDPAVSPSWIEVTYVEPRGALEQLPCVPPRLVGATRGVLQVQAGLGRSPLQRLSRADSPPFDAVFYNSQALCLSTVGQMRRVPSLIHTDVTPIQLDAMGSLYERHRPRLRLVGRLKQQLYVDIYHTADLVVAYSRWTKRSLLHDYGVREDKVLVLSPGVDLERWSPATEGPRAARTSREGLPRLLFVGGHFERKGGRQLLDWFVQQGRGRCKLQIVTRTPPRIDRDVPGLHVITDLESNDPRLTLLYQESDLFVLPTLADCYSIASIEAMATGLPVVTTDVGGISDIVEDGVDGFLIAPGDGAALGERLNLLLADAALRCAMSEHALAKVRNQFDARMNTDRLLAEMKRLADSRPHGAGQKRLG